MPSRYPQRDAMPARPQIWSLRDGTRRLREIADVEAPICADLIKRTEEQEVRANKPKVLAAPQSAAVSQLDWR
jgi:hypothetical protein